MKKKIDFAVGGQALIEGVMMRSPHYVAMAVRKQDDSIKVHDWPFKSLISKYKFLNIPVLRGVVNMVEMLIVGTKAMNMSAEEAVESTEEIIERKEKAELIESHKTEIHKEIFSWMIGIINFLLAIALGVALFKFVPLKITELIRDQSVLVQNSDIIYNMIDGVIKTTIFILYIVGISLIPTIGRVFEYHGAEHMSVFAYEADLDLNEVSSAAKQSRFHPRCGTSFIFLVILISILIYTFLPRNPNFLMQLGQRLLVLPIIAGVAFEVLKVSAKHMNNPLVKLFIIPGLWLQRLTTRKPKDNQLEVALEALNRTLELEKNHK